MKNIYIYCEGQTEESFINEVLAPYFANMNIWISPIVCTTKKTKTTKSSGGVSNYSKIKNELTIICRQHRNELVTTMFDYYGIPTNTPQIDCTETDLYKRIKIIEKAITADIGQGNCFFGLMLHEFESLLFSKPEAFLTVTDEKNVAEIQRIRTNALSPEHINNSFETAPSKRLEALIRNYAKVRNGTLIAKEIGIDRMLNECKHFSEWVKNIRENSEKGRVAP